MGEDEGEGDKIDYPSSLPSPARGEGIVWRRRHFVSWRNRLDQNLQKLILDMSGLSTIFHHRSEGPAKQGEGTKTKRSQRD
jgi:hypothetical protein